MDYDAEDVPGLVATDCTGLLADEFKTMAEKMGLNGLYEAVKQGISFPKMQELAIRHLPKVKVRYVDDLMGAATSDPKCRHFLDILKAEDYTVAVVSDNPMLTLPKPFKNLTDAGVDYIYTTCEALDNGKYFTGSLKRRGPKESIVMELVERLRPVTLLGIGHAKNDEGMMEAVKSLGGATISVGDGLVADHFVADLHRLGELIYRLPEDAGVLNTVQPLPRYAYPAPDGDCDNREGRKVPGPETEQMERGLFGPVAISRGGRGLRRVPGEGPTKRTLRRDWA